jgi:phage-related minor tail protein
MADFQADLEQLDAQMESLETNIAATARVSASFQGELDGMKSSISSASREVSGFSRSLSTGLRSAFGDLIFDGARASDVLREVGRSMIESTFNRAISPVTDALSGLVTGGLTSLVKGLLPAANGAAFSAGRVTPFASGGVVSSPTRFAMRGGVGLMGEAGPEAIMPLSRGADGRLGVRNAGGARPVMVTMNIQTPNAESFARSRTQIAAGISRAIQRGGRNL